MNSHSQRGTNARYKSSEENKCDAEIETKMLSCWNWISETCSFSSSRMTFFQSPWLPPLGNILYSPLLPFGAVTTIIFDYSAAVTCFEGCLLSNICRSVKQEVGAWFTYSIHIPSESSCPLCAHSCRRLQQDSKTFWKLKGDNARSSEFTAFAGSWALNGGQFPPRQLFFDEGEQPKVTWSQVDALRGIVQNLDILLL